MKFLLAAEIPNWRDLAPTRENQVHSNALGEALQHVKNSITNNGARDGEFKWPGDVSVRFQLEATPAPPVDEAA